MARAQERLTLDPEPEPSCTPSGLRQVGGPPEPIHRGELDRLALAGRAALAAAHDLNNLLVVLGLGLQQLERTLPEGPARTRTTQLSRMVERAGRTVLALRAAAPCATARVERLDLGDLLRACTPTLVLLAGTHVHLVTNGPSVPLQIDAARDALEQVLMNLVTNASDAAAEVSPRPVRVTVAALETAWPGGVTSSGAPLAPGRYAALEVSDDGPGVPPERRRRLFEPFHSSKPSGRGTGLGLTLVAETAHAAGGGVVVESTPGAGATFRLLLPLAR